jgi:HEPN domain-containing protein
MSLDQRFFEAAKLDLATAKVLTKSGHYQPALYHMQQTYEKGIKSYFIFKEVNINHTPEADLYSDLGRKLGHETEESTIMLLKDLANIEKQAYLNSLKTVTSPQKKQNLQNAISAIEEYVLSLNRLVQRLDLVNNYIHNIKNYLQFVKTKYQDYQNSVNAIAT